MPKCTGIQGLKQTLPVIFGFGGDGSYNVKEDFLNVKEDFLSDHAKINLMFS